MEESKGEFINTYGQRPVTESLDQSSFSETPGTQEKRKKEPKGLTKLQVSAAYEKKTKMVACLGRNSVCLRHHQ